MKKIVTILSTVLLAVFMLMSGVSQATPIQGSLWEPANSSAQDPRTLPGGSPTATFTVNKLDFYSLTDTSYDNWLQGGSGNPNGLAWINDGGIKNQFFTSPGEGTFFQFTGTAYFPANVVITHDDGFVLILGGTTYDSHEPTVPADYHLYNAAGTYAFTLNYGAWNGFPEVLRVPGISVPEPMTMLLLGLGLIGVAGVGRKFKK